MKLLSLPLSALILGMMLTGCPGISQFPLRCELPEQGKNQGQGTEQQSETISINVQVDATPSLKGFVAPTRPSRYRQTLDLLDVIATASWSSDKSTIKYYRFGTKSLPMTKNDYIRAKLPEFYAGGGDLKDSQLQVAIPKSAPNQLSLIVTDLYQTDQDITSVINKLKTDYLQKGYAVGILGIKSEFEGTVYDIGIRRDQRYYTTQGKEPTKFRPFYVLFLGEYQDIVYFFDKLKQQNPNLISSDNFIIFTADVIAKPSSFQRQQHPTKLPQDNTSIREVKALNNGRAAINILEPNSINTFLIAGRGGEPATMASTIPYHPSPYTLLVDPAEQGGAFQANIQGTLYDKAESQLPAPETQALQFSDWQINESDKTLSFNTIIKPDILKRGVYGFTVDIIPKGFQEPEWWQSWNFDESQFDPSNPAKFDGSTTLNLRLFLQGLKNVTTDLIAVKQPVAARLCFAIQRD